MATYPNVDTEVQGMIPFEYGEQQKVLISNYEDGKEQRRVVWSRPRKMIKINYKARSIADLNTIRNFYQSMKGPLESFTFFFPTSAGGAAINARFSENPIEYSIERDRADFTVELVELIA